VFQNVQFHHQKLNQLKYKMFQSVPFKLLTVPCNVILVVKLLTIVKLVMK
jgi:hypothetical protein